MKKRAISALAALMIVGSAAAATGDGAVRVSLDDSRERGVEIPASAVDEVKEIVNWLGAFSTYNEQSGRLKIEKPNVNIMVVEGVQVGSKKIYFENPIKGWTDKDIPRNFNVFVEVDNAPSASVEVKVVLVGPDGREIESGKVHTANSRHFFFTQPFISARFPQYGTYKVQLLMKPEKNEPFVVVGENSFTVGR